MKMPKQKLPSCVVERSGKYIASVMVNRVRMSSPAFSNLEDHIAIKAKLQWALKQADGDKALAKQIYANEDVYKDLKPATLLSTASTSLRKEEWTLREAFDATVRYWERNKAHKSNITKARQVLHHFKPNTKLSLIDNDMIERYTDNLMAQGLSNCTIVKNLAALSKMLNVARKKGRLLAMPVIERPRVEEHKIRWIGQDDPREEQQIINLFTQWGKTDHLETFIVLLDTGMRQNELFNLHEFNINLDYVDPATGVKFPAINLHANQTKNRKARPVPVTSRVSAILKKRMTGNRNNLLFPYDTQWLRFQWDRIRKSLKKTDDDSFTPHITRHSWATKLVQRGVSLPVLQELGGWKTMGMVMRYAHLCPTNLLTAVKVLEKATVTTMPQTATAENRGAII